MFLYQKCDHIHSIMKFRDGFIVGAQGGGGCTPPLVLAKGGAEGAIFHDKAKKYYLMRQCISDQ